MNKVYTKNFFENRQAAFKSAEQITPLIYNLLQPESVVDVGCGLGEFLYFLKKRGVQNIKRIDGEWVDKKKLLIPEKDFYSADLEKPLNLKKKFDLVISLEVAEHISYGNSKVFIENLISLGPIILFSAAIPFQGGVHHVNEQWQEHWVKLFKDRGYIALDIFRKKLWNNKEISPWYAQNILLFINEDFTKENKKYFEELLRGSISPIFSIVHPRIYLGKTKKLNFFLKILYPFRFVKKILGKNE
jgi:SAM-dependent methyltransferase